MMPNKDYQYEFTVVMSVYQVEQFIDEAIESLIHQTIGFDRIQLILVDDGSKDGSGTICDRYQERYPAQVMVLHKENGGLSSARNAALPYAEGKYVSFIDPDDVLDLDAFEKVLRFMELHEEVDICCIPLVFFGKKHGAHPLNNKFNNGTRVVDLTSDEDANCVLLSAASSFFRASVISTVEFDTQIYTAEDAKAIIGLLMDNPRYGVVSDTVYHYRKHGNSILDGHGQKKAWYYIYLKLFSEWAVETAKSKFGYVPKFVQYTVMYDLQWKLRTSHVPEGVMSDEETLAYRTLLFELAAGMDDDVIVNQKSISTEIKLYLLRKKHGESVSYYPVCGTDQVYFGKDKLLLGSLNNLITKIHFMKFEGSSLVVEGSQFLMDHDLDVHVQVLLGDCLCVTAETVPFTQDILSADIPVGKRYYFKAVLPLDGLDLTNGKILGFQTLYPDFNVRQSRIVTEKYAPVSTSLQNSYFIHDRYMLTTEDMSICVQDIGTRHAWLHAKHEGRLLKELAGRPDKTAKKAVISRLLYHALKPFHPNDIWLITDKANRADDNGEVFFRYLVSLGNNAHCHPVFALDKNAPGYRELRKIGRVVPYMSWRFKLLHLLAEHTISAYSHDELSNPFMNYAAYYCDLMQRNKIVFLQHGITKDDISKGLNRFHKNFALFVTSVRPEQESIINGNCGYSKEQIVLTGMPRYDCLYDDAKKYITIMPTWQRKLCGKYSAKNSQWELLPGFEESQYYRFYTELLTNDRFLSEAQRLGYTVRFLTHPVFLPYVDRFHFDKRVQVFHQDVCYREIFAESALITTDYSSAAFDFVYLNKPVVYTHFDSNNYAEGYFDYERDGFGEVEYTVEDAVDRIIEYMKNGCRVKPLYQQRIDNFFEYHDRHNCERVYREIKKLDSSGE